MKNLSKGLGEYVVMLLIWVALLGLFGLLSDNFLSIRTLSSLANRIPPLTVVAVGMTFVLVIGGIDLSVGSVLGLAGSVMGIALTAWHLPLPVAMLAALGTGLVAGVINGLVSVKLGVPSFIVSLGLLEVARGFSYLVTNSQTQYLGETVEGLARPAAMLGGVSPAFVVAVGVVIAGQVLLTRTVFGRYLIAIGTNEAATRLAGIAPQRPKILVFAMMGFLTGLGAIFYTSHLGSSDPNAGVGLELSAIAAVVIGGTSLMGGRGSVINTFLGVLIIATLESGLAQTGASEPVKRVVTGLVIIIAVMLDAWRQRFSEGLFAALRRRFTSPTTHS